MRLYVDDQYLSPYALCVFVALQVKNLGFDIETLDLAAGEQKTPEFLTRSLTGRVPLLMDGPFALAESTAITEYLEAQYPQRPALYPEDLIRRSLARQVQAWLRSDFMPLRQERSTEVIFRGARHGPLSDAAQRCADHLTEAASRLLSHGLDHVFGAWSVVDVDLAVMLGRLVCHGDPVPDRLAAYTRRQFAHPAIEAWAQRSRRAAELTASC